QLRWLSRPEPDTTGANDPLVVRDLGDDHVKRAVLGLQHDDRLAGSRRAERGLELVRRIRADEAAHDLPARETELAPYPAVSQLRPPARERRGRIPDGRRRPRDRTCRAAASRRSVRRLLRRDA